VGTLRVTALLPTLKTKVKPYAFNHFNQSVNLSKIWYRTVTPSFQTCPLSHLFISHPQIFLSNTVLRILFPYSPGTSTLVPGCSSKTMFALPSPSSPCVFFLDCITDLTGSLFTLVVFVMAFFTECLFASGISGTGFSSKSTPR
jgi:hypothetical protein